MIKMSIEQILMLHTQMIAIREVDFYELALIMRGLNGCVRERIFNNLPKRVAVHMAEDIEYMGK